MPIFANGWHFGEEQVTDRLLHVNVWWGRFGVSDWMIDVDRGTVVYDELLNYYKEYSCVDDVKKTGP